MENEKIDEIYSKLLDNSITEEDKKEVMRDMYEDNTPIEVTPEDATSIEAPESTIVNYNPATGDIAPTGENSEKLKEISNIQFNNFINNIPTEFNTDILSKVLSGKSITDLNEIKVITNMIKRRASGEKIDAYNEFPPSVKNMITMSNITSATKAKDVLDKSALRLAANYLLDQLVKEYKKSAQAFVDLDIMLANFDKETAKMVSDTSRELGNMMISTDTARKARIDNAIEECKSKGNTEGVEKLEKMKGAIDDAYNLDKFIEFCSHVKIKKFDLEKPSRIYSYFTTKYANHENNINDIRMCPDILDRHIPNNHENNLKLCLAFCKYTMNMSPDNVEDHTFMYYFIRNIITIDRINPKGMSYETMDENSKAYYDGFIANINKCILNLTNRTTK